MLEDGAVFHHGHLVTLESFSAWRHTAEKEKEDGIKMEKENPKNVETKGRIWGVDE